MRELQHFYNDGFGWVCRKCEQTFATHSDLSQHARFYREGEAESKNPAIANSALARWADAARTALVCPRCGAGESIGVC